MNTYRILTGSCLDTLPTLETGSAHCCVTSPPYWGLRDYGCEGQLGLEKTPDEYVARMVSVFREVRRVLRDDGTLWLNVGDSYAASAGGGMGKNSQFLDRTAGRLGVREQKTSKVVGDLKPKDLVGIPWMLAFALRADGWYLRSEIIWSKPNPMPESVTDRPTKAHEQVFLLSKSPRYYFDAASIAEPSIHAGTSVSLGDKSLSRGQAKGAGVKPSGNGTTTTVTVKDTKNARSVWTITSECCKEAHFAVMPRALARPCILAGCPIGGTVLDPFGGAGTVACEATAQQRNAILCELNPAYVEIARRRIEAEVPMFAREVAA